jgi:2-keto-4-pentenoate hydratase
MSSSQKLYTKFNTLRPDRRNNSQMTAPTCSPSSAFAPDIQAAQVVWKHWQSGQTLQALPESGARVPSAGNRMRVAEPEFAFTMAQDLTPQTAPYSLADNACARHFVLGPAAPEGWRHTDLSQHVVQAQVAQSDSVLYSRTGSGAWVLGGPRIALTWLANQLSSLGITLQKGHVVTTGTCMVPLELEPGTPPRPTSGCWGRSACTLQTKH